MGSSKVHFRNLVIGKWQLPFFSYKEDDTYFQSHLLATLDPKVQCCQTQFASYMVEVDLTFRCFLHQKLLRSTDPELWEFDRNPSIIHQTLHLSK